MPLFRRKNAQAEEQQQDDEGKKKSDWKRPASPYNSTSHWLQCHFTDFTSPIINFDNDSLLDDLIIYDD